MAGVLGEPDGAGTAPILTWELEMAESVRRIAWTLISGGEDLPDSFVGEGSDMWWKYTTENSSELKGDYYLSWKRSGSDVTFSGNTTWSSPSVTMQWHWMPFGEGAAHSPFTMWYAPRQNPGSGAVDPDRQLYLLTEEPLPSLDTDIRVEYRSMGHTR